MTESLIDTLPSPTPGLEPGLIARLAADLGSAGWSVDAMETMISPMARAALMRNQRVPALRELQRKDSPAAVLTRFFVLGCAESGDVLAQALPTLGVRGAVELGLIFPALDAESPSGQQLFKANYDLRPHAAQLQGGLKNWWILSDLGEDVTGEPIRPDHVLGIGGATTSLLKATLRTPVESALDLGCGCGIQALYLATHATRVVATDLSSRACEITRFNAALNGVELDVRQGSLFEPVEGEEFDLIASNPPFVITPDSLRSSGVLEYRDGGMSRDHLVRTVIRESPNYLKPGGVTQLLANWEIPGRLGHPDDWQSVVRRGSKIFPSTRGLCSAIGLIPLTTLKCGFVTPASNCISAKTTNANTPSGLKTSSRQESSKLAWAWSPCESSIRRARACANAMNSKGESPHPAKTSSVRLHLCGFPMISVSFTCSSLQM